MKAYPLIYSRTYNEDFNGFLVYPSQTKFNEDKALDYMRNVMKEIQRTGEDNKDGESPALRYVVFSEGNYCVVGYGAKLRYMLEYVRENTGEQFEDAEQYLEERNRRPINCFMGYAFSFDENKNGEIPDVKPEQCLEMFLEYIKKLWKNREAEIEYSLETVAKKELSEIKMPETDHIADKEVLHDFSKNSDIQKQETFAYYIDQVLNQKNLDDSFISEIRYIDEWWELQNSGFKNIAVSEKLYQDIRFQPEDISEGSQKETVKESMFDKVKGQIQNSALQEEQQENCEKSTVENTDTESSPKETGDDSKKR